MINWVERKMSMALKIVAQTVVILVVLLMLFTTSIVLWYALIVITITLYLFLPFWAHALGQRDIFFTVVDEGRAKAIMRNRQFSHFIMSFCDHAFKGTGHTNSAEHWEIERDALNARGPKDLSRLPIIGTWMEGIFWIGPPPIFTVYRYVFKWVSFEYGRGPGNNMKPEKEPIPHEEEIGHILIQKDVYYVVVREAETKEGIPAKLSFLLTIEVTNPYKALFSVERWLEAVTNQCEGDTREFIGTKTWEELFNQKDATSDQLKNELKSKLAQFKEDFGVNVVEIQIQAVDPDGERASKYRELTTKETEAQRLGEAKRITALANSDARMTEARGERKWLESTAGYIAEDPNRLLAFKYQQMSQLRGTFVEGGSSVPIAITPSQSGPEPEPTMDTGSQTETPSGGAQPSAAPVPPPILSPRRPQSGRQKNRRNTEK